jgi:hypothetical protein
MLAKVFEICNLTVLSVSVRNLLVAIVDPPATVVPAGLVVPPPCCVGATRRKPLQRVYNYLVTKSHNLSTRYVRNRLVTMLLFY